MPLQKFTVFLMSQEDGYQVIVPHYPNCTTEGDTVEEALANAKDAMEGLLYVESKHGGDKVEPYVYAPHVVVATVDIEVPEGFLAEQPAAVTSVGVIHERVTGSTCPSLGADSSIRKALASEKPSQPPKDSAAAGRPRLLVPVAAVLHGHNALAGKHVLRVPVEGHFAAGPAEVVVSPPVLAVSARRVVSVHFHQTHRVYRYGHCLYLFCIV